MLAATCSSWVGGLGDTPDAGPHAPPLAAVYQPMAQNDMAFYPGAVDRALVDGEQARPQPGGFYGGWITDDVVGPFKGAPGTLGW